METERVIRIINGKQKKSFRAKNEKKTEYIARMLAKKIHGGTVLAIQGNLGSGKTTFVRGLAKEFHIDPKKITSPTFVLMKIYSVSKMGDIRRLCHIDAYRLSSPEECIAIGVQDYLYDPQTVTAIEWPERLKNVLPPDTISIHIKPVASGGKS